jgi:hypothetical protein
MTDNTTDMRKPYLKPEIVQEMDLETRAGSEEGGGGDYLLPGLNLFPGDTGN